jgi:hypothetical protein
MKQPTISTHYTVKMKSISRYFPLRSVLLSLFTLATIVFGMSYVTLVSQNARADNPPTASLAFDTVANKFELTINTTHEASYLLSYVHTDFGSYPQEGVTGSGSDASGIIKKTIYAGTCSAGLHRYVNMRH